MIGEIVISSVVSAIVAWLVATRRKEQLHTKMVKARDFAVIDNEGRTRASLGMGPTGPVLEFSGETGKLRLLLGMDKGIPALILGDEHGNDRIMLHVNPLGPCLVLLDSNKKIQAQLQGDVAGGAMLTFFDEDQNSRITISQIGPLPVILVKDEDGKVVFSTPDFKTKQDPA